MNRWTPRLCAVLMTIGTVVGLFVLDTAVAPQDLRAASCCEVCDAIYSAGYDTCSSNHGPGSPCLQSCYDEIESISDTCLRRCVYCSPSNCPSAYGWCTLVRHDPDSAGCGGTCG